jgi:hypothetical protein
MKHVTRGRWLGVLAVTVAVALSCPPDAAADDGWRWSLTPYMWASDISETLLLDGAEVGGDDTEFSDVVDTLDTSLQLHFEGVGDRWGLFGDVTYIELSDSAEGELGFGSLDVEIEEMLLEGGLIWRPGGGDGRLELLLGARYLAVDELYRLEIGAPPDPYQRRVDEGYLDALVGLRYNVPLSPRWMVSLRGDVSAGGTDLTWTAQGLFGWRFGAHRNSAFLAGYRYRELEYGKADVLDVEKTLSGFVLGLKIGF